MEYLIISLVIAVVVAWYRVEGRDKQVNAIAVAKEATVLTVAATKWLAKDVTPTIVGEYRKSKADYDYLVEKEEIQPVHIKEAANDLYSTLNKEYTHERLDYNKRYVKVMEEKTKRLKVRKSKASL